MEKIKIKLEKKEKFLGYLLAWKNQLTVTPYTENFRENSQEKKEDIPTFEHAKFQIFNICVISRNCTFSLQEKVDIKLKTISAKHKDLETSFFK